MYRFVSSRRLDHRFSQPCWAGDKQRRTSTACSSRNPCGLRRFEHRSGQTQQSRALLEVADPLDVLSRKRRALCAGRSPEPPPIRSGPLSASETSWLPAMTKWSSVRMCQEEELRPPSSRRASFGVAASSASIGHRQSPVSIQAWRHCGYLVGTAGLGAWGCDCDRQSSTARTSRNDVPPGLKLPLMHAADA